MYEVAHTPSVTAIPSPVTLIVLKFGTNPEYELIKYLLTVFCNDIVFPE
jgi:hypothetical protein